MRKNTSEKQIRLGTTRDATKTESENSCHRSRLKRVGNRSGRTDGLRCLPHFSSCCFPCSPGPCRLVAQNLRIPVISNSVSFFQQQLVFDSFFRVFVFDVTPHCHQQCASAHLANSASPISFNRLFFSWGHDPFTHACKAKPLAVVGWTSLSVIVVVVVVVFFCTSTMFVARRPATVRFRFVHSVLHGTLPGSTKIRKISSLTLLAQVD